MSPARSLASALWKKDVMDHLDAAHALDKVSEPRFALARLRFCTGKKLTTWIHGMRFMCHVMIHTFSLRSVLHVVTFSSKRASRIATAF